MKRQVSIQKALERVAENPQMQTDDLLSVPVHEMVARTLFEIANSAKLSEPRSMSRANAARTLIFDRLVGRRRAGSHPATRKSVTLQFKDLAKGVER